MHVLFLAMLICTPTVAVSRLQVWHIVSNTHAIAVNQAWTGGQGAVFAQSDVKVTLRERCVKNTVCDNFGKGADPGPTLPSWEAWYKPLPNESIAIFIANHADTPVANLTISFADVPAPGPKPPPPPAAKCDLAQYRDLGDVQCSGLRRAPSASGLGDCCAACRVMGAGCETWQFCAPGKGCATGRGVPIGGGCYVGKMGRCKNVSTGWVSYARSTPSPLSTQGLAPAPAPPNDNSATPPPAHPKLYTVTDVWRQTALPGTASSFDVSGLASHDSVFITLSPP